jgi:hypothetical protein
MTFGVLAELPELSKLAERIAAAEEEYMAEGPPMSPITRSYFNDWTLFDLGGIGGAKPVRVRDAWSRGDVTGGDAIARAQPTGRAAGGLMAIFRANNAFYDNSFGTIAQAGDYAAMEGHDYGDFEHSGIVMGVANDGSYLYTIEGNNDDCVKFVPRWYSSGGVINGKFNGFGSVSKAL